MKALFAAVSLTLLAGCSVVGKSGVENAPYTLLQSDSEQAIELRNYESMILVSTSMPNDGQNSAFRKLFKYITGANEGNTEIAMTAPVLMNDKSSKKQGAEIAMTAPVFMQNAAEKPIMSFVMPKDFTLATTPKPTNDDVWLTEVKNYKVAAIQFSGTLSDNNVQEHTKILESWIADKGLVAAGQAVEAGYNGPLTLPMFRRNEVMIEVQ